MYVRPRFWQISMFLEVFLSFVNGLLQIKLKVLTKIYWLKAQAGAHKQSSTESSRNIRICQKRGLIYNEESGSNIIWPTTKVLNVHDNSQLGILTRLKSGKKCNPGSEIFFKICWFFSLLLHYFFIFRDECIKSH